MFLRRLSFVVAALSFAAGCGAGSDKLASKPIPPAGPPTVAVTLVSVGLDPAAMDRRADPCTDFYQFACGGWMASAEIPKEMPMWSRSYGQIFRNNDAGLKEILEAAAAEKNPDPATRQLGDYFASCMDQEAIDAAGIEPIKDLLGQAQRVKSPSEIMAYVADLHAKLMFPIFLIYGDQDPADATRVIAKIDQEGLGLPDRDYYVEDDDDKKKVRKQYVAHIERLFVLAGYEKKRAATVAADVLALETELAKVSKTGRERMDPKGMYNLLKVEDLARKTPHIDWRVYFEKLGLAQIKEVNVTSIPFFEGVDKLLTTQKATVWQNYLAATLLRGMAKYLSKPFEDEDFAFQKEMTGQQEQKPRWKRCRGFADDELGEVLAQPYVAKYFGAESKRATEEMVRGISAALAASIGTLTWMDAKTRTRALEKLAAIEYLIGYPTKWRTYDFPIDRKKFAVNTMNGDAFEQKWRLGKIGKPVDRAEWTLTPPTVNAYYEPQRNQVVFAAGVLQPPIYDPKAAVPVNFGAVGSVIGHEILHGFDKGGSLFAANGNLENWWQPETRKQFDEKSACVLEQYSKYEILPGVHVDGELTLDENMADIAGLKFAYQAYRQARKGAATVTVADGFTEDQQFFLAMGQFWCEKSHDEFARTNAKADVHAPGKYRVNGSVTNSPEFAAAFSCKEGTPMHPAKTCDIW